MTYRRVAILFLFLVGAFVMAADKAPPAVEESWVTSSFKGQFRNLVVIGITDDQEVRHHFEDKFVSHLRGNGIDGVPSHSLVADLQKIESRDRILDKIMEQKIDGAISVRLVPLEKGGDEAWQRAWAESVHQDANLRTLIEETLPVEPTEAKRFGLELAVWETSNRYRVWAGRSNGYKIKELRKSAGDFIGYTVDALKDAGLL